jgi:hypothetical protein
VKPVGNPSKYLAERGVVVESKVEKERFKNKIEAGINVGAGHREPRRRWREATCLLSLS